MKDSLLATVIVVVALGLALYGMFIYPIISWKPKDVIFCYPVEFRKNVSTVQLGNNKCLVVKPKPGYIPYLVKLQIEYTGVSRDFYITLAKLTTWKFNEVPALENLDIEIRSCITDSSTEPIVFGVNAMGVPLQPRGTVTVLLLFAVPSNDEPLGVKIVASSPNKRIACFADLTR